MPIPVIQFVGLRLVQLDPLSARVAQDFVRADFLSPRVGLQQRLSLRF